MPAFTKSAAQEFNRAFFDKLQDPGMAKEAADGVNDWTRTRIREDGFARHIQPMLTISADELDRQYYTDEPVKVIDKEPDQPPAVSVPYGGLPINYMIRAPKYQVTFARILSPRFTADMARLRTYTIDVRQVMADNAIKDMLAEEDSKYIKAWNTVVGSSPGVNAPMTGAIQYSQISGGIERNTYKESRKVMPRTPYRLEAALGVINNVTVYEFEKWGRDEWGGDGSEKMLRDGWTEAKFDKLDWVITIKQDLVAEGTIWYFADPKFIGKLFELEPPTMWVKREFWNLEYFLYEEIGSSIGHGAGGVRVDFV
jgi:hypothetical protein